MVKIKNKEVDIGWDETVNVLRTTWTYEGRNRSDLCVSDEIINVEEIIRFSVHKAYNASVIRALTFPKGMPNKMRRKMQTDTEDIISQHISRVLNNNGIKSIDEFIAWEKELANEIRKKYRGEGVDDYTYGNAQKWINLSIKYILSSKRIDKELNLFKYSFFPIDEIIQKIGHEYYKIPYLKWKSWSKCDDWNAIVKYELSVYETMYINGYHCLLMWEILNWSNNMSKFITNLEKCKELQKLPSDTKDVANCFNSKSNFFSVSDNQKITHIIVGTFTPFSGRENGYFYSTRGGNSQIKILDKALKLKGILINKYIELDKQKQDAVIINDIKNILTEHHLAFLDVIKEGKSPNDKDNSSDDNIFPFVLDFSSFEKVLAINPNIVFICNSRNAQKALEIIIGIKKPLQEENFNGTIKYCSQCNYGKTTFDDKVALFEKCIKPND